jgi:protein-tyrosine phosphatase
MEPFALLALGERGVTTDQPRLTDFRARELTEELLSSADLVLTATTEHRAQVVGLVPAVVRHTFTLKEFARIADAMKAANSTDILVPVNEAADLREQALARVRSASQFRGMAPRPGLGDDDVEDPLGAPKATYDQRADEIQRACSQALDLLLGVRH